MSLNISARPVDVQHPICSTVRQTCSIFAFMFAGIARWFRIRSVPFTSAPYTTRALRLCGHMACRGRFVMPWVLLSALACSRVRVVPACSGQAFVWHRPEGQGIEIEQVWRISCQNSQACFAHKFTFRHVERHEAIVRFLQLVVSPVFAFASMFQAWAVIAFSCFLHCSPE